MKLSAPFNMSSSAAALVILMALAVLPGCSKKTAKPGGAGKPPTAGATTNTNAPVALTNLSSEYVSVFDAQIPLGKRKDPFFPESHRLDPAAAPSPNGPAVHVEPVLVLKGVTGGPGRWLAIINSQVLAVGEDAAVRSANGSGKVNVHVVEIGENYAVITIQGQPGQTRLTWEARKR